MKKTTFLITFICITFCAISSSSASNLNYYFGAVTKPYQHNNGKDFKALVRIIAQVDHSIYPDKNDNALLAADHYKYLVEALRMTDWQETDYLDTAKSTGEIYISLTKKEEQIVLIVELDLPGQKKIVQYPSIKSLEKWYKDEVANQVDHIFAQSFQRAKQSTPAENATSANNYFGGAIVKVHQENKFNGQNIYAVMRLLTQVNHTIEKNWRANVVSAHKHHQQLINEFNGWHTIDYFTNKPVHGELKTTFDPRFSRVVTLVEFDIKDYQYKKKYRQGQPFDEWLRESVVAETELRLKEEYRLK